MESDGGRVPNRRHGNRKTPRCGAAAAASADVRRPSFRTRTLDGDRLCRPRWDYRHTLHGSDAEFSPSVGYVKYVVPVHGVCVCVRQRE